jgi:hypothetical protein
MVRPATISIICLHVIFLFDAAQALREALWQLGSLTTRHVHDQACEQVEARADGIEPLNARAERIHRACMRLFGWASRCHAHPFSVFLRCGHRCGSDTDLVFGHRL